MNSPHREPKFLCFTVARMTVLIVVLSILMGFMTNSGHVVDRQKTRKIQAAYLLNFLKFMKWPDSKHKSDASPLVIGVFEDKTFAHTLDRTVKNKTVRGRPVEILRLVTQESRGVLNEQLQSCHLLFIAASQEGNVSRWITELEGFNVVTVSDIRNFARRGGMVGFVMKERKIRFQANVQAIRKSDVLVSSKLLRLAEMVESK